VRLDPATVLAERDARPVPPPLRLPVFDEALALAADDAARLGHAAVQPEHLLVGLLRQGDPSLALLVHAGRLDLDRLRTALGERLRAPGNRVNHPGLPMHADAQAAVEAAVALATERRQEVVHGVHLLAVLLREEYGGAGALLTGCGGDLRAAAEALPRWL
jgi:ATP-dependent Clp protease ATP-binding subunit ClpC